MKIYLKRRLKVDEVVNFIANVGFPIAVSIFLLARIESKLDSLSDSISDLSVAIKELKQSNQYIA